MKKVNKLLAIIALVAVIGFSFTACDDGVVGEGGGGGDGGDGIGTASPPTVTTPVVTPDLSGTITITPNNGVQTNTELTANYSGNEAVTYQWKKADVNVGENSNKYTPTEAGSYTVTVSATGYKPKTSGAVVVTGGSSKETAIPLTLNQWADGGIPANGEQWFTFTATANTQYIHASFGTLTYLYVQVYDSSGATVGTQTNLYSSKSYISQTVSTGQTYYIKVTPYSDTGSGTYQIAFNTSTTPPVITLPTVNVTALTLNTWENGNLPENGEQWFTFTATASPQYIHASFGTLTYLYVQVYDSSGATVGTQTNLYSSSANKYISRTVTTEQTYYIKVTPYSSSYSGTYKIGFNTGFGPPGVIPLILNQWADGNLPQNGEQWFTFSATASPQYIHASFGALTDLYVQVYNSSGTAVGDRTRLYSSTKYISREVSTGQTYYIKVTPYSSSYSGTYKIGFNTGIIPPSVPLTLNTWVDGNLPANGEQWFTFTATASKQYVHASFGTLTQMWVQVYDSSGATVGTQTSLYSTYKYISREVSTGQTYYIKVTSSVSGTYKIAFNTGGIPPGVTPTTLTLINTWTDGNLPSNGEQWFTFTATADTQYIHASFGTLTELYVRVYDSSGATVGTQTNLNRYSTNKYISREVSTGQTYYIEVTPYGSSYSGTYQIAFNTGFVPPGFIPLTLNTWADGNLSANGEQWFTFTATADTQYIHASFGTLTSLYVQVYESDGATVGDRTNLYSSTKSTYRSVTTGQTYYIKVTPYSSSYSGTYQIAFNTGIIPPGVTPTALTLNQWEDGNLPEIGEQWFYFMATADTQYIHVSLGTLTDLYVQVYESSGATVGDRTNLYSSTKFTYRSVTTGQTYYIKVTPYSSSYSGTYQIAFNTGLVPPGVIPTALTLNTWENGSLPENGEQWFSFKATADTQYIHASFLGSLTRLYVQVYDSSGATVGDRTFLADYTIKYISRTVLTGQTYYIKVTPYLSSGTYQIAFNTSTEQSSIKITLPTTGITKLNLNQWANGNLPQYGEQWFTFTATAGTQYIHASFGTLTTLWVQVYDSNGATVGDRSQLNSGSTIKYISRTVSTGQTYYIKVTPYLSSDYSGTYQIAFNTSTTAPGN
jgi:predicted RNA-binding protein with TRAM domain